MKQITQDIQTKAELKDSLNSVMESGLPDFIKTTHARRISVRANIRFVVVSVLFILAIAIFLFLAQVDFNTLFGKLIVMTALLWVSVLLVSGKNWFIGSTLLAREVNMALVPILANTFNRTVLYTYNQSAVDSVQSMLDDSGLVTSPVTTMKVSNVYTVFSNVDMRVHEIMFEQQASQSDSKSEKFNATFIDVNIGNEQTEEMLFFTSGNKYGFSHAHLKAHLENSEQHSPVELPEGAYQDLSVFSTNADKTVTDISTAVLNTIHDWHIDTKVNIRVMRKGAKLYILVPASKGSITYTSTSTNPDTIERYAGVIAEPVWRALMLAEEMTK
jgi:hypothetical protein